MAETTITLQVDPDLKRAFSLAAEAHNRTDEDLLREFMQDFIETQPPILSMSGGFVARCKSESTKRTQEM